ncbi:N-acetylglucosamine-6-phosphate deacetylase [Gymnodinialimonas ceratoperidinii]|uniref:N-acetylglucosamine-6-phosphate deacetylase n=1 Tax=Gymnodinialimonas ceratoperidinii TaxID=2856823 RepID=A0A8F6TXE2_9RHOB|nr:N-acetylglucosamine-6-phosphate deacetylase [Gymnodinialimonas ceratoperidinii]QXT39497.1 N-acetylglucosamine-6-phosphate deacetylase [Gymnodinialimonas ceratoperidinii]
MTTPDRIFARRLYAGGGAAPLENRIVEMRDGVVQSVTGAEAPSGLPAYDLVAPGFIDLQINGAADVQFNFEPTAQAAATIAAGAREGGTAHVLPTFITAEGQSYRAAISAVREAMAERLPGVLGVHLEGPFLSPERPGIHPAEAIRVMAEDDIAAVEAAAADMPVLLTLAPECHDPGVISRLAQAGVHVFAGHSAASADQIAAAEAAGLRGATHLFNAMSQLSGREPGVVGAVMFSDKLYAGIIVDGHHVDWRNVALAAREMEGRLCLVTDAMLTLAGQSQGFDLLGKAITLDGDRLTDKTGRLAGAHVDMITCVRNMVTHCGADLATALHMASGIPAEALGLQDSLGRIAAGYRASLTCLNEALEVQAVMVDGTLFQG